MAPGQRGREGFALGVEISKGFVDDHHTSALCEALMKVEERGARNDPPIGVVRVDHDRDIDGVDVLELLCLDNASAGRGEGGSKTTVGRRQHANHSARQNVRQGLDERLRARARHDAFRGDAVTACGDSFEFGERAALGQPRPRLGVKIGQGIGVRIDSRGEVDPGLGRAWLQSPGDFKRAAVIGEGSEVCGPV